MNSLEKIITSKVFGPKDCPLSYRQLSYWSEKGLLTGDASKWHKFSFLDLIEVKILNELRLMGLPLKRLKEIKTALNEEQGFGVILGEEEKTLTLLLRGILSTLDGENIFLLISRDADYVHVIPETHLAEVLSEVGMHGLEHFGETGSLITILSFRLILDDIKVEYKKKPYTFQKLMRRILDEEFENLDLVLDKDSIKSIHGVINISSDAKYSDVNLRELTEDKNQKIEINVGDDGIRQIRVRKKL